jgi:hypothetical protein
MRSKVTVVLLFLNVVLFAYIYWYDLPHIENARNLEARRRVLPTEIASMDSLTRTNRTGEVVKLEKKKDGESWWITKPYEWPASTDAVSHIHNELQFLEHETSFPVADLAKSGQSLADYGLADPAVTLEFTAAGKSYKLLIGDDTKVGNRLYVLSPDGERVHVVGRSLMDSVGLPLAELRNDAIFTIPVFEVRSLNIQTAAPSNLKVRVRRDAAARWAFESPILARASKTVVEVTINALNSLAAKTFVDPHDADLDRTGLNSPLVRVTLEGNARRETLLIGGPAPTTGDYYAKIEDKPVIFTTTVHPELLKVLRSSQEILRDTHVLDFEPATVTALTLTAPAQPELVLQRLEATVPAPSASADPAKASAAKDKAAAPADLWQVVTRLAGQAPVTVPGDPAVINGLLQKIKLLAARETVLPDKQVKYGFLSDAPAAADVERYGFNRPEREVTLNLNTGGGINGTEPSTAVLQIGVSPDEPGKAFARLTNPSFVYEILPDILADTPVQARHYRLRQLRDLPEGAVIINLTLVDLAAKTTLYTQKLKEGDKNWDATLAAEPEATRPVLASLLAQVGKLRAQDFVADTFLSDHAESPQGPHPWRFRLDYSISFNGGDATKEPVSNLYLTERLGGATQLAGTTDFGGVVFNLTQEMIDALFPLTYGNKHDPGPPAPAAAAPATAVSAETKAPATTTAPAAPAPTKP